LPHLLTFRIAAVVEIVEAIRVVEVHAVEVHAAMIVSALSLTRRHSLCAV
jgi:hypothetical protein